MTSGSQVPGSDLVRSLPTQDVPFSDRQYACVELRRREAPSRDRAMGGAISSRKVSSGSQRRARLSAVMHSLIECLVQDGGDPLIRDRTEVRLANGLACRAISDRISRVPNGGRAHHHDRTSRHAPAGVA